MDIKTIYLCMFMNRMKALKGNTFICLESYILQYNNEKRKIPILNLSINIFQQKRKI